MVKLEKENYTSCVDAVLRHGANVLRDASLGKLTTEIDESASCLRLRHEASSLSEASRLRNASFYVLPETLDTCWGCRLRRQGDDVNYGVAYEEMEELCVDIIGYGMSVVAEDTVPWCSSCRRSTSRRQRSASLGQQTAECR